MKEIELNLENFVDYGLKEREKEADQYLEGEGITTLV